MSGALDPQVKLWALITIAGSFGLMIIAFAIVGGIAFSKVQKGAGRSFGLLFQRGNFLRLLTALAVIEGAVILSLAGALTEGAAAILSAVAGFVLGGLDKAQGEPRSNAGAGNDKEE